MDYQILVKAILDSVDLQSQLNKIPITKIPKVKASVEIDAEAANRQIELWQNKITSMQIGKNKIINREQIERDFIALNALVNTFGKKGGASVEDINMAFSNLSVAMKVAGQSIKDVGQNLSEVNAKNDQQMKETINSIRSVAKENEARIKQEQSLEREKASDKKKYIDSMHADANSENIAFDAKQKEVVASIRAISKENEALAKQEKSIEQEKILDKKRYIESIQIQANAENAAFDKKKKQDISRKLAVDSLDLSMKKMAATSPDAYATTKVQALVTALNNLKQGYLNGSVAQDKFVLAQKKLNNEFAIQKDKINSANAAGKDLMSMFELAGKKVAIWAVSTGVIYGIWNEIKLGIQYIKDLNKEMTNIQIVTGATNDTISEMSMTFNKLATQLGATTLQVATGSTEWFRQGKTIEETAKLMQSTMMLSKLGNMDAATSTERLTSTLNGFKLGAEDAMGIVSKLISLDNSFATSSNEISEGLSRSANSAQQAGTSFDELASYIKN
jgi:hypothetical protein